MQYFCHLTGKMASIGSQTPYHREWQSTPSFSHSDISGQNEFSVMTYNILNDTCISDDAYDYCDVSIRYMSHRHKLIREEIREFNAAIVCMQEINIDQYDVLIGPMMADLGYECICSGRDHMNARHADAIFYKSGMFTLMKAETHTLVDYVAQELKGIDDVTRRAILKHLKLTPQVVLAQLCHKISGKDIHVASVHIHWGELLLVDVQVVQTCAAIRCLQRFLQGQKPCYILAGDFNTPPGWPAYQVIDDMGRPSVDNVELLRQCKVEKEFGETLTLVDMIPELVDVSLELKSSYKTVLGHEPSITSCDYDYAANRTRTWSIDYIWFSPDSLDVASVLQTPPDDVITQDKAIPSHFFPSDHIPLVASFVFKN